MSNYHEGRLFLESGDYKTAQTCFQAGACLGDPRCLYGLLAVAAATGEPVTVHIDRLKMVIDCLLSMAEEKDPDACFIVGRCYETGSALEQNIHAAMKYYTQAAGLGNVDAMYNLGCMYMLFGDGGAKIALDYFRQAADKGCREAKLAMNHYTQAVEMECKNG